MRISHFFIDRPIFASVVAIVFVILGGVAFFRLPVAQYPEIAPPTVIINTSYPGASAETIAQTVAAPIEERLSGVENLLYFNSTSSSTGDMSITATFEVGTNVDTAVFNVNNRVQLALPRLPDEVRRNGVTVQKRSQDILLLITLQSPDNSRDTLFLSNYATITLVDELKRVPGVADVNITALVDFHRAHGRLATVTTVKPPARFGRIGFSGDQVTTFCEKPEESEGWINGGFFVLNASALDYVAGDDTIWEREPIEGLARDGELVGYRHFGFWSCMDTLKEKTMLEELWASGRAPWKTWIDEPLAMAQVK